MTTTLEPKAGLQCDARALNPAAEQQTCAEGRDVARDLKGYLSLAVILVGVIVVTPAWIAMLGWLMVSLFGWLLA